jgi:hypothetical protein
MTVETFPFQRDPVREKAFFDELKSFQGSAELFPLSKTLWVNEDIQTMDSDRIYDKYLTEMEAYRNEGAEQTGQKSDFRKNGKIIPHWKFHLNVEVSGVKRVSDYLKGHGFCHKYLSGGEPEEGKIFTVYVGSKNLAETSAVEISRGLGRLLTRPRYPMEIEFARGVIGRFDAHRDQDFSQYSSVLRGIPELKDDKWELSMLRRTSDPMGRARYEQKKEMAFQHAYRQLAERYGTYFYGSRK